MTISRIIVSDLLRIKSELKTIHYFSYGENLSREILPEGPAEINITFRLREKRFFKRILGTDFGKPTHKFSDSILVKQSPKDGNLSLFFYKRLPPLGDLYLYINENPSELSLTASKFYYNLFKFRIENVLPVGVHLRDWAYVKLLEHNYLSVHSSSVAPNENEGCLIIAPPNVGKSSVVLQAIRDELFILSEDISVVDGDGLIHSVPLTSTFFAEHSKLKNLGLLSCYFPTRISNKMNEEIQERLIPKAKLKYVLLLEPSNKNEIHVLQDSKDRAIMAQKVLATILNEFNYLSNSTVLAKIYSSEPGSLDVVNAERALVWNYLINGPKLLTVKSKSPLGFYSLIRKAIEEW